MLSVSLSRRGDIQDNVTRESQLEARCPRNLVGTGRFAPAMPMVPLPPSLPQGAPNTISCFGASQHPVWARRGSRPAVPAGKIRWAFAACVRWLLVVVAFVCSTCCSAMWRARWRGSAARGGANGSAPRVRQRWRGSTTTRAGHRQRGARQSDVWTHVYWATLLVTMGRCHAQGLWTVSAGNGVCELSPNGMCVSDGDGDYSNDESCARCVRRWPL
jgi:hypothetical protein